MAPVGIGLGTLQVVLDKGQRGDWFNSRFIEAFSVIAITALVGFLFWEWREKHPIVELRLFKHRTFAVANLLMLTLGAFLLSTTVLIPQFVQTEMGYTAQKAGEVLSAGGVIVLLLLPIVGQLISRVDARLLIAFGFVSTALALFHMMNLNLSLDPGTLTWWRVYQAAGIAFLFVPINTMSYTGMPAEASNQVSAMVNLMRNLGGSIGISAATTLIARRTQIHENYLAHNQYQYNPRLQTLLSQMTQRFGSRSGDAHGLLQSYRAVYATVEQQATVLAYVDTFWISGILCLCAVGLLFLAKKAKPGAAPAMH